MNNINDHIAQGLRSLELARYAEATRQDLAQAVRTIQEIEKGTRVLRATLLKRLIEAAAASDQRQTSLPLEEAPEGAKGKR